MATKQGSKPAAAAAADQELDPAFQWQENGTNYVLRLDLSGFKKEDFRVQVDGAGRLTVRGQRQADGKNVRFHKVFQLPSTANLDGISGRFDANFLTLTVPKRPATAPTTIDEIKKPQEEQQDTKSPMPKEEDAKPKDGEAKKTTDTKPPKEEDAKPKDGEAKKTTDTKPSKEEDEVKKALDEASKKQQQEEEEAKRRKQEQEQKPTPAVRKEEVMKPNAEAAARPTEKAFDRESQAERVRRCGEEAWAKAPAAAEEAKREKKTVCGRWKERVVEELEQLADLKWADGLVEAARKNKEVIAVAVAAFSLGFFVSQKLLSRK